MSPVRPVQWLLAVLLGLSLAGPLVWFEVRSLRLYTGPEPDLLAVLSRTPAQWTPHAVADGTTVSPTTQAAYDRVLIRNFEQTQGAATVVATWSRDGRYQLGHDQETCYRAQGFHVSGVQASMLQTPAGPVAVTRFTARRGELVEEVLYWRLAAGRMETWGTDAISRRVRELLLSVTGQVPDRVMVRVSTRRQASVTPPAVPTHEAFVQAWLPALSPAERQLVLGR